MKRDVLFIIAIGVTVGGLVALMLVSHQPANQPTPATTTAPITTHVQPATGVHAIPPPPIKEAEKDAIWKTIDGSTTTATTSATVGRTTVNASRASTFAALSATDANAASTSTAPEKTVNSSSNPATDDPYHDSMLPGGSKWENVSVSALKENNPNPDSGVATATAPSTTSEEEKNSVPNARRVFTSTKATTDALNTPSPNPSAPEWTRCSTSWAQTLSLGKNGEQIWAFSTTLSDADVQDFATSVRWYADIQKNYPKSARNYAWLDCAGWRVRDYHQHASNVPPADYFGAQGLDSPLGTCHSSTPVALHYEAACGEKDEAHGCSAARVNSTQLALGGVLEDDGKVHGLVRWAGDGMFYEGTIADVACVNGCSVEFDHPCSLPSPLAIFFTYRGAMQTNGKSAVVYSWWFGEDPRAPGPWVAGWMAELP